MPGIWKFKYVSKTYQIKRNLREGAEDIPMIKNHLSKIQNQINDDDVYDDALRNLQDALEDLARLSDDENVMEVLQQVLLTRQFLRKLAYKEVAENVQRRLREFAEDSESQNDININRSTEEPAFTPNDEVPAKFQTLMRILNKINTQDLFDDGYGYVKKEAVVRELIPKLENQEGEISEENMQLINLTSRLYQEEYEHVDKKHRTEISNLFTNLLENPDYLENPYPEMERIVKGYKNEVHENKYGWPSNEE